MVEGRSFGNGGASERLIRLLIKYSKRKGVILHCECKITPFLLIGNFFWKII